MRPGYVKANLLQFEELRLDEVNLYLSNSPDKIWYNQYRESDDNFRHQFIKFLKSINEVISIS